MSAAGRLLESRRLLGLGALLGPAGAAADEVGGGLQDVVQEVLPHGVGKAGDHQRLRAERLEVVAKEPLKKGENGGRIDLFSGKMAY
eukprot:5185657-Pyramimonas_sp.AAC.1